MHGSVPTQNPEDEDGQSRRPRLTNAMEPVELDEAQRYILMQLVDILCTKVNVATVCGRDVLSLTAAADVIGTSFFLIGSYWMVAAGPEPNRYGLFRAAHHADKSPDTLLMDNIHTRIAYFKSAGGPGTGPHYGRAKRAGKKDRERRQDQTH